MPETFVLSSEDIDNWMQEPEMPRLVIERETLIKSRPVRRTWLGRFLVVSLVALAAVLVAAQLVALVRHDRAMTRQAHALGSRVTILEHACGPVDTGGGVTQCANPSVRDLAVTACLENPSYYADGFDPAMVRQCVADWYGR